MEMLRIRFIRPYGEHKVGDVLNLRRSEAHRWLELEGVCEWIGSYHVTTPDAPIPQSVTVGTFSFGR